MRAVEPARQDRLFTDRLADAVVDVVRHAIRTDPDAALPTGPAPGTGGLTEAWSMLAIYFGVRTAHYDRVVREAAAERIRQVVVPAARCSRTSPRSAPPAAGRRWSTTRTARAWPTPVRQALSKWR